MLKTGRASKSWQRSAGVRMGRERAGRGARRTVPAVRGAPVTHWRSGRRHCAGVVRHTASSS